jgi:hypothetical protein
VLGPIINPLPSILSVLPDVSVDGHGVAHLLRADCNLIWHRKWDGVKVGGGIESLGYGTRYCDLVPKGKSVN